MSSPVRSAISLLLALSMPAGALASSSIANELTVSATQPTPGNPRSGNFSDRFSGSFELSRAWELHGDLSFTRERATPAQAGASFGNSASNVLLVGAGADYLGDHLFAGGEVTYSPKSTQLSDTYLSIEEAGRVVGADALMKSTSSSAGVLLSGGWQSGGFSPESTSIDGSLSVTRFDTVQSIAAVQTASGPVSAATLSNYCTRVPLACRGVQQALIARPAAINQGRLALGVSQTVRDDTDLSLGVGYYLYNQDPTEVGYFSVATVGRTLSMGNGVPIAPLQLTAQARVGHRFLEGKLGASLWYSHARYVADLGFGNQVGMKLQYRFHRRFRAWVSAAGNDDVDSEATHSKSGSLSLGARYSF